LTNYPECARALAKYRINPGNVGRGNKHDPQFAVMVEKAIDYGKPIRIGVNWGSLDQDLLASLMDENGRSANPHDAAQVMRDALITSAIRSAQFAEALGLPADRIILACKVSNVQDLIAVYTELAKRCDYPLHLGLTEAGMGSKGIVASTAAMAVLLQQGIGDTIRASLTPDRTAIVRAKCWSRRRSCRRWAFVRSLRSSARAPDAAGRRAISFRISRPRSKPICGSRCRAGGCNTRASKT